MKKIIFILALSLATSAKAADCFKQASEIYTKSIKDKRQDIKGVTRSKIVLKPGEENFVGPNEIWNDSKKTAILYVGESSFMGVAFMSAILLEPNNCELISIRDVSYDK